MCELRVQALGMMYRTKGVLGKILCWPQDLQLACLWPILGSSTLPALPSHQQPLAHIRLLQNCHYLDNQASPGDKKTESSH